MRCKKHNIEQCSQCRASSENSDDDGFVLGLATGVAISPMGIIGSEIHNSMSDSSSDSSCSDYSASSSTDYSCSSSCDSGGGW